MAVFKDGCKLKRNDSWTMNGTNYTGDNWHTYVVVSLYNRG